jgi:hypothetical protein
MVIQIGGNLFITRTDETRFQANFNGPNFSIGLPGVYRGDKQWHFSVPTTNKLPLTRGSGPNSLMRRS